MQADDDPFLHGLYYPEAVESYWTVVYEEWNPRCDALTADIQWFAVLKRVEIEKPKFISDRSIARFCFHFFSEIIGQVKGTLVSFLWKSLYYL